MQRARGWGMASHGRAGWPRGDSRIHRFARENGLSIVALILFVVTLVGQALSGLAVANSEARAHGEAAVTLANYLHSGSFIEAVFENWESEFLQIAVFVVLTKHLRQRGSSESKAFGEPEEVDDDPREKRHDPSAPWPVRKGGLVLTLYERSLSLVLVVLFGLSVALHAYGGARKMNDEALRHAGETVTTFQYLGTPQFWFESFENWQSEFLSVAVLVLFSIYLRERGSPQSKPVAAPHAQTGE